MVQISYWVSKSPTGSSIRGKTRQAVEKKRMGKRYSTPKMVSTPWFTGSFDMLEQCLSDRGAWWEDEDQTKSGR